MSASRGRSQSEIEAGMFQVSYDVMGSHSRFQPIREFWLGTVISLRGHASNGGEQAIARACGIDSDPSSQLRWRAAAKGGSVPSARLLASLSADGACTQAAFDAPRCFRIVNQNCPVFAVDFNAAAIRVNRPHWGPLNVRSIQPSCGAIFKGLLERRDEVCAQPGFAPNAGEDPARNDD